MSKKLDAKIKCPQCSFEFPMQLYRSIWIEDPANRALVLDDKINAMTCPGCKFYQRLEFPFLCTNVKRGFALWYEPYHDSQIDRDIADYRKHAGPDSYYVKAPRIADWETFKKKLLEIEAAAPKQAPTTNFSPEWQKKMAGFISHLDEKNKQKQRNGIIKKFITSLFGKTPNKKNQERVHLRPIGQENDSLSLEGVLRNILAQDAETLARGEIPEKRLVPHHAIKRDVIISAYIKDFKVFLDQIKAMNWSEDEKQRRLGEIQADFDKHIYGVKRLGWQELDRIIALMKKTRTDFLEIEKDVRSRNTFYEIVDPL